MDKYYENAELWNKRRLSSLHNQVSELICKLIKDYDRKVSIADCGCGDGIILNKILASVSVPVQGIAIDISENALSCIPDHIVKHKVSLENLSLGDREVDISYCVDVLEHVQKEHLQIAIDEILRVTKGVAVFVTPFLETDMVKTVCPHCKCMFNPYHHVNMFSIPIWKTLIEKYSKNYNISYIPLGGEKFNYPMGLGLSWVAAGNSAYHKHHALCPQCGNAFSNESIASGNIINLLNPILSMLNTHQWQSCISDELAVVLCPKDISLPTLDYKKADFAEIHHVHVSEGNILTIPIYEIPKLTYFIKSDLSMFPSYSYIVDTGDVQLQADGFHVTGKSLRFIFPLCQVDQKITINIVVATQNAGDITIIQSLVEPFGSKPLFNGESNGAYLEEMISFSLSTSNWAYTPYGFIVDLYISGQPDGDEFIVKNIAPSVDNDECLRTNLILSRSAEQMTLIKHIDDIYDYSYILGENYSLALPDLDVIAHGQYTIEDTLENIVAMELVKARNGPYIREENLDTGLHSNETRIDELRSAIDINSQSISHLNDGLSNLSNRVAALQEYISSMTLSKCIKLSIKKKLRKGLDK